MSRVLCAALPLGRRPGERADHGAPRQTAQAPPQKQLLHASARDTPRVHQARVDYRALIAPLDLQRLQCIDESGMNLAMTRLYGRAPRGARVLDAVPRHDGPHITILGTLGTQGITAVMTVEGATDADVLLAPVEHVRAPRLRPGDLVVRDHLRAHNVAGVPSAMAAQDAPVLSWPPYSPDLSPIEPCWPQLKPDLRTANARTRETLDIAMTDALATISVSDARRGCQPCGYA